MKATKSKKAKSKVSTSPAEPEMMVALTVKIDSKTYVRLGTLRAKRRMTTQDVLSEALKAYLDQAGKSGS
jgi:hypothetical protein